MYSYSDEEGDCYSGVPKSFDTISFPAKAAVAMVILTNVMQVLHFQQQPSQAMGHNDAHAHKHTHTQCLINK